MKPRINRRWVIVAVTLLIVAVAGFWTLVGAIGIHGLFQRITALAPGLVAAAAGAYVLEIVARLVRWGILFDHPNRTEAWNIWWFGTGVNEMAPTGTGELARTFVGYEAYRMPAAKVLVPTGIERLMDMVVLVAAGSFAVAFMVLPAGQIAMALGLLVVIMGGLVILRPEMLSPLARWGEGHDGLQGYLGDFAASVIRNLAEKGHHPKALAGALLVTTAIWTLEGTVQWIMLTAFGVHLPVPVVIGITAVAYVAGFFSFLPGGLGAREAALSGLFVAAGADFDAAGGATVVTRAAQSSLVLIVALATTTVIFVTRRRVGEAPVRSDAGMPEDS